MSVSRRTVAWPFFPSHASAFVRLRRMLTEQSSFMLCFLVFSDSTYRDRVAEFLADNFRAHVHVTIDPEEAIGTEELFSRLNRGEPNDPAQLSGLERWPEGLDNLLTRLNLRREALPERCQRPVLVWILSTQVNAVAMRAADLWAWRSGVFQFVLPKGPPPTQALDYSPFYSLADEDIGRRRNRIERLHNYLTKKPVALPPDIDLLCELGGLRLSLQDVAGAQDAYARAQSACWRVRDRHVRGTVECGNADVLEARGQWAEAQRLREEQVPVFRDAGDVRSEALVLQKIADGLRVRGRFAEALSILVDRVVPAYERLQDNLSRAIALGGVAEIHFVAGRLDDALRIHKEERLPIFQQLGEQRRLGQAHTQIAAVLLAHGQFDEALRTMTSTVLRLWEELGDVHASAVAQSRIGDIHQARGEIDNALRIRTDTQLPVFDRLGDLRSAAITRGQIATIWQARGQFDEALRLCIEDELPIYERIGDWRCKAVALGRLADILRDLGQPEEALRKRRDEELPLYQELGDVRAQGVVNGKIADVLDQLGRTAEAQALRASTECPIDEAYGVASNGGLPEYVPYERGGVLYEGQLADSIAGTYRSRPVDGLDWTSSP